MTPLTSLHTLTAATTASAAATATAVAAATYMHNKVFLLVWDQRPQGKLGLAGWQAVDSTVFLESVVETRRATNRIISELCM